MKNNLVEHKFSDIYEMGSGISTKPEQAGHGFPFISFSTIFNNPVLPDEISDLMDTSEKERVIYSVKKGDVLLTRTSETIDELAMSSVAIKDYPNATFSGFAKRLRPIKEGVVYPQFMAYFLRSDYFRKIINCKSIMTLRASFNEEIFSYIKAMMPSYSEQIKIGDLCFLIEKKIRNNNKINAELESMAKTLYDYWFLQFEFPNEEGKPYKSSGGKMVWNEELKREIPEGWTIRTVLDCSNVVSGYPFKTETYSNEGRYNIYTIGNVQDGYIDDTCPNKIDFIPNDIDERCVLKPCDIIMSLTGNVGRVGIVYTKNALLNQRVLKVIPFDGYHNFLYLLFRNSSFMNVMQRIASGTSQKNLSPNQVCDFTFAVPNKNLLDLFNLKLNGFIDAIVNNLSQNQELTSLRDFLLPLLMNGQVTFKEES